MTGSMKTLIKKLREKEYRTAYAAAHTRRWIAHQIRALREMPERNWKQGDLACRVGKPQSVVSRLENPSYGKMTIQTLLDVAAAFDVALVVKFVDFNRFLAETRDVSDASMRVFSFEETDIAAPPLSSPSSGERQSMATRSGRETEITLGSSPYYSFPAFHIAIQPAAKSYQFSGVVS